MKAIHIHPKEADEYWHIAEGYIQSAINKTQADELSTEDVLEAVKQKRMALWIIVDKVPVGAFTIAINDWPQKRIATVVHLGADKLEYAMACWDQIEQYAKENQATAVNLWGRKGWTKPLKELGFCPNTTCFSREI